MHYKESKMRKIFILFLSALFFTIPVNAKASSDPNYPSAIISVSPTSGYASGGNTVTITGINFDANTYAKIGSSTVPTTFVSSTQLTIIMPSRSVGFVSVAVYDGSVGAVLPNAYQYVADPSPSPTPSPTPTPTASATPTPTATASPTPTPSATSSPYPTPTPTASSSASPTPTASSSPSPSATTPAPISAPVSSSQGSGSVTSAVLSSIIVPQVDASTTVAQSGELKSSNVIYLSDNAYLFYEQGIANLVVTTNINSFKKYNLQQKIVGGWKQTAKSYSFNGYIVYKDVKLVSGQTYKVITRINKKATIVAWFTVML
jgi:hypothetical protein